MMRLPLLLLAACALPAAAEVELKQSMGSIEVLIDGRPFTTFYFGPDEAKPYLHPLRAADGAIVTRQYPMDSSVPGEAHDHPHHRGLWFSHGDVNGYDFWGNEPSQQSRGKKGRIALKGVHKAADGLIRADFEWLDPDGDVLLGDDRTITFRPQGDLRIIDYDIRLRAKTEPVKFGDTKEGTFAVRVAATMRETRPDDKPGQGLLVTSEGKRTEDEVWGSRAKWADYSGPVNDKTYGIAIFDSPQNPKHPTWWHARAYGLFAANPFGEHDFYSDENRDGSITLQPDEEIRFLYRVVIHPGDAEQAGLEELYREWVK